MSELEIGIATSTEVDQPSQARPTIWPVILWIIFTELTGDHCVSSFAEFIEQQPEKYTCQDQHEEWLLGRFHDIHKSAVRQRFHDYTSQLEEADWAKLRGLVNCRKSRSLESTLDVAGGFQTKLWAFIWITAMQAPTASLSMAKDICFLAAKLGTLLPFSPFPSDSRDLDLAMSLSLSESVPGKSIRHVGDVLSRAIRELPPELAFEYPRSWLCGRKAVLGLLERDTNFSNSSMIPLVSPIVCLFASSHRILSAGQALPYWIQYTSHVEARCGPEMRPLDVIATLAAYSSRTEEMLQWISSLPEVCRTMLL